MTYMIKRTKIAECVVGDGVILLRPTHDVPVSRGTRGRVHEVQTDGIMVDFGGIVFIPTHKLNCLGFETKDEPASRMDPVREAHEECEYCGDTGLVPTDEDDGEGHTMRGTGTKLCICQKDNEPSHED